jgi:hypothetical protein
MKITASEKQLTLVSSNSSEESFETSENTSKDIQSVTPYRGLTLGTLIAVENNRPVIYHPNFTDKSGLIAQTIVPVNLENIGSQVLLSFIDDKYDLPVIVGFLLDSKGQEVTKSPVKVELDGESLVLTAEREIVLRCGEANITLTRAGKILIKGAYVLSCSSGYNKIKGAAVDIN